MESTHFLVKIYKKLKKKDYLLSLGLKNLLQRNGGMLYPRVNHLLFKIDREGKMCWNLYQLLSGILKTEIHKLLLKIFPTEIWTDGYTHELTRTLYRASSTARALVIELIAPWKRIRIIPDLLSNVIQFSINKKVHLLLVDSDKINVFNIF